MDTIHYYVNEDWLFLMDAFGVGVEAKEYVKMPYQTWRALAKTSKSVDVIFSDDGTIHIREGHGGNTFYVTSRFDCSIGSFLWDCEQHEEEDTDMAISGYSYLDSTTLNAATAATATNAAATYADVNSNYYWSDKTSSDKYNIAIGTGTDGIWNELATKADIPDVDRKINEALKKERESNMTFKPKKENDNMKGFNFDFGPCTNDNVRMSMYGLAVKNAAGTYVSYNAKSKEIVDVDILNFDGGKYMYKMPVALSQVAVGDVVIHNRKPMFVIDADLPGKNLTVVDVCAGEQKQIIPTVNMFGFNFITKIVSLMDMCGGANTATADQPFGNMLPLLMMNGDSKNIDPMLMAMLMVPGSMSEGNMFSNPMMLYALMSGDKQIDPMMLFAMSGAFNNAAPKTCKCGCHDGDAEKTSI